MAGGTVNVGTPAGAVAAMPGTRPHDSVQSAVLAFFATGNTKDAAAACGQTHDTLKTNIVAAFRGSKFGAGLSQILGKR